jgi:putative transcriptional regulator
LLIMKNKPAHTTPDDLFEGKTFGELLVEGAEEFADALERDKASISKEFTCHTMTLDLEPTCYTPELVKETRQKLGASQVVFARFLGVSVKTVHAWEQGVNIPKDSACRFMDEIRAKPDYFKERLAGMAKQKRVTS